MSSRHSAGASVRRPIPRDTFARARLGDADADAAVTEAPPFIHRDHIAKLAGAIIESFGSSWANE
jgi:hypothetical protein